MTRNRAILLMSAMVAAVAVSTAACAQVPQTASPGKLPAMQFVPSNPTSPRDSVDRKDVEKDRSDSQLAIERDKCGGIDEGRRAGCIQEALEARDRFDPTRRGVAAPAHPAGNPGGHGGAR